MQSNKHNQTIMQDQKNTIQQAMHFSIEFNQFHKLVSYNQLFLTKHVHIAANAIWCFNITYFPQYITPKLTPEKDVKIKMFLHVGTRY